MICSMRNLALTTALIWAGAAQAQQFVPQEVPRIVVEPTGPLPNRRANIDPVAPADIVQAEGGEWLTYHGDYSGRRHSPLSQIHRENVSRLHRAWVSETNPVYDPVGRMGPPAWMAMAPLPAEAGRTSSNIGFRRTGGVRSSPIYRDGVLFYTNGQNAYALDARTGRQLWHYIANSSGGISNRGLGISGDTVFMMANGGLTAISATTGEEQWRVNMGGAIVPYAPMVVGETVFVSVGSGGGRSRARLEARNVADGSLRWSWTSTPEPGQPGAETWPSVASMRAGGGSPWQPLTYDPQANMVYFGTGNADPMKDGRTRMGDNLYTSSIVALHADSGEKAWHFSASPHDDHDYDATQVTMLFDREIDGVTRHLLTMVGRNGFYTVIDRITGEVLASRKVFEEVNWSNHNRPNGSPEPYIGKSPQAGGSLVFPSSEGVTNWPAPSYSPETGLIYFNAVKSQSIFYLDGEEYFIGDFRNSLNAVDPITGEVVWRHEYQEPYGIHARYPGVLTTAGGLVFTGDVSGNIVAFDASDGEILWHDELPLFAVSNAPVSYSLDGKQYVVVGTGDSIVAYTLQ